MRRELSGFTGKGYDKGRSVAWQMLWVISSRLVVERTWCPPSLRCVVLRLFGAKIGRSVLIRHHVSIHWPWKLEIADNVWIGVDTWLLNLEKISIGSDVCISQGAFICTGSHDVRSPTFEFDNAPVTIEDGAWISARATILRGVTIGENSVIGATALVTKSVAKDAIVLAPRGVTL